MIEITVLKKNGRLIKVPAKENIQDIWDCINGNHDINSREDVKTNHEYFFLTDLKGKKFIFNKRFVMSINEVD